MKQDPTPSSLEEGRQYLKALNQEWPDRIIEVNKHARICGVVLLLGI